MTLRSLLFCLALPLSLPAAASDFKSGHLQIRHPYARATVPNQPSGAAYLTLENTGKSADQLVALAAPIAKRVEMHTMSMEGTMMKMREVDAIEIKPAASVTMKPGDGYHLMLTGLKKPLKAGDTFPLTLTFRKAGQVKVVVAVEAIAAAEPLQHKH